LELNYGPLYPKGSKQVYEAYDLQNLSLALSIYIRVSVPVLVSLRRFET
jgi:hypothetical protein